MDELENVLSEENETVDLETQDMETPEVETPDVESEDTSGEENEKEVTSPEYSPSFKYRVLDAEKEFPESIRGLIKTKDDEKYWRDVFTKADALDTIKQERETYKQKTNEVYTEYTNLASDVQRVTGLFQQGMFGEAFKQIGMDKPPIHEVMQGFGYSKDEVIKLAAELYHLTPEQEQYQNQNRQLELRARQLEAQMYQMQTSSQQAETARFERELGNALSSPQYQNFIQQFEAINGQGSFKNEVALVGHALWEQGVRKTPEQVVTDLVRKYGFNAGQVKAQQPSPLKTPQPVNQPNKNKPRVIPATEGSLGSPGERKIRTMDDLEKEIARELRS